MCLIAHALTALPRPPRRALCKLAFPQPCGCLERKEPRRQPGRAGRCELSCHKARGTADTNSGQGDGRERVHTDRRLMDCLSTHDVALGLDGRAGSVWWVHGRSGGARTRQFNFPMTLCGVTFDETRLKKFGVGSGMYGSTLDTTTWIKFQSTCRFNDYVLGCGHLWSV